MSLHSEFRIPNSAFAKIFQFPNRETFRLAITSGIVPASVSLAAAEIAADAQGRVSVKPAGGIPPKAMQNALKKLGVVAGKEHLGPAQTLTCWLQGMPLTREATPPELTSSTPVLFEMSAEALPAIVGEMMRLGNDRQSFRHLAAEENREQRVLLRVIGPPYYTLLRAIDKLEVDGVRVIAYLERSPNVWVEIGWTHPLIEHIHPPEKQLLLMRPPGEWTFLDDAPFHDVYEILDFQLPQTTIDYEEGSLPGKLEVPLRLVPGNAADVAEMWVIRKDAADQLDALVRDADERIMTRLSFAVAANDNGEPTMVLRTRPSKMPPPVLSLENAVAFKPYWKLQNLFVPVGRRLSPQLRRDAVRKLLADDPAHIVWLMPGDAGAFVPESLPDEAFRPLADWIRYVIDQESQVLTSWVEATRFDFDQFICRDDQTDRPKDPPAEKGKKDRGPRQEPIDEVSEPGPTPPKSGKKKGVPKTAGEAFAPVEAPLPNELKKKREELEEQFKQMDGALDAPERLALWPELAKLNAALLEHNDAAICWANSLWEEPVIPAESAESWARGEVAALKIAVREPAAIIERILQTPLPSPTERRAFVAALLWAATQCPVPSAIAALLPEIRRFLEMNERDLGIRATWLAWLTVAQLSGKDVLGLARARDRVLQRLLDESGLSKERDLPTFLRLAGVRDSERLRRVREKATRLRELALQWVTFDKPDETAVNRAYANLLFAFGMSRLGETTAARELVDAAANVLRQQHNALGERDAAHQFLLEAFQFRIEQAIAGRPHSGALSPGLLAEFDRLTAEGSKPQLPERKNEKTIRSMVPYLIERMREQSHILDPHEKADPYRRWKSQIDPRLKELGALHDVKSASELQSRISKLVGESAKSRVSPELFAELLGGVLTLAPRAGESFTVELLQRAPAAIAGIVHLNDLHSLTKVSILPERALFLAAHFDQADLVQTLTNSFLDMLKNKSGKALHDAINHVAGQCLRSLRKVGLRVEIDRMLTQMADLVLKGQTLHQLRAKHGRDWIDTVAALLHLSAGWLYFNMVDTAMPYLDEARLVLLDPEALNNKQFPEYAKLAANYAATLGLAPVDIALSRIEEMFQKMARLPNSYTTASHYSRFHLAIVDAVVLSIVSDDFALGPTARRWLDDDEYLVRRRIHRDMKGQLAHSGF